MSYDSPDIFYMEDGVKWISFSMNHSQDVEDDDLVETSYAQNDEGGWGVGEGGNVTREDILVVKCYQQ